MKKHNELREKFGNVLPTDNAVEVLEAIEQWLIERDNQALRKTDVMCSTPKEKWENLKRYIIEQTDKIDKETEWQPNEPEWWLEMTTISRNVRQYCP